MQQSGISGKEHGTWWSLILFLSLEQRLAPLSTFLTADFNNLMATQPGTKFTAVHFILQRCFIILGLEAPAGILIAKGTTLYNCTINFWLIPFKKCTLLSNILDTGDAEELTWLAEYDPSILVCPTTNFTRGIKLRMLCANSPVAGLPISLDSFSPIVFQALVHPMNKQSLLSDRSAACLF